MHKFSFNKKNPSVKINYGGPTARDQLLSIQNKNYWTVLNTSLLNINVNDKTLVHRANAFKHSLQTYGPTAKEQLPDFRNNTGKAKGYVYHGHVNDANGVTYILEWAIIDHDLKYPLIL